MIISKTPYRISFFGGGTDFPLWFKENGGSVLSTSIDKYCYISCRYLPKFFEHNYRFVYSTIEDVRSIDEIKHPAIKGVLQWMKWTDGIEMHHDGDLPARSGLGSSSSFTVGLINTLNAMRGKHSSKIDLANDAIFVEQNVIKETVGCQDQIAAAYGGFNRIDFFGENSFSVHPIIMQNSRIEELQNHLLLFFTGISRFSNDIEKSKVTNFSIKRDDLNRMQQMVPQAIDLLSDPQKDILEFGYLMNEAWRYKKSLSTEVSNPKIDEIYDSALKAGAIGGKLLGAGGGGFFLFFAQPKRHSEIKEKLAKLTYVPFKFEFAGSDIVLYQPNGL